VGVAGSPVIGRRRGRSLTLLLRPGLRSSSDAVLATESERKMLARTCLYSLYAWFIVVATSVSCSLVVGKVPEQRSSHILRHPSSLKIQCRTCLGAENDVDPLKRFDTIRVQTPDTMACTTLYTVCETRGGVWRVRPPKSIRDPCKVAICTDPGWVP